MSDKTPDERLTMTIENIAETAIPMLRLRIEYKLTALEKALPDSGIIQRIRRDFANNSLEKLSYSYARIRYKQMQERSNDWANLLDGMADAYMDGYMGL